MSNVAISAKDAGRPSHIVVFKKSAESNQTVLVSALGIKGKRGKTAAAGIQLLTARHAKGAATRMFTRIGAAAVDLDDDDIDALMKDENVDAIYPNELRFIPKPPNAAASGTQPSVPDPMVAYLQGMRDAADMALRFAGHGVSATAHPGPGAQLFRRRSSAELEWHLSMVNVNECANGQTGRGIKLAVLDTGLDLTHPDFSGRAQEGSTAESFIDGESVQDGNGHGTHCCGLSVGPFAPTQAPRYGVAPEAELLVGKVLSDEGSGWDDGILEGMEWAVEQGARVISMSLGSGRSRGGDYRQPYENIARTIYDDPNGALIIVAAGNDSFRPWFRAPVGNPAAAPSIVAVAAIDEEKEVGYFSNAQLDRIGMLDICAPGVDTRSSWTGGGYKTISGTSMATPIVAGCAALILQADPSLTPRQLRERLIKSAVPVGDPSDYGQGLVQAP